MAAITLTLTAEEQQQLVEAARSRDMTPESLASRWVRERLVHERERAAGGGQPKSPRAGRRPSSAS